MKLVMAMSLALLCVSTAMAKNNTIPEGSFPVGLWNTTHYTKVDPTRNPVRIQVCVKNDGTWQSINSADGMGGTWVRSGDDVHLAGNGVSRGGTGDITVTTPYKMMSGTWQSWSMADPTKDYVAFNSKWDLAKAGTCK